LSPVSLQIAHLPLAHVEALCDDGARPSVTTPC
jgi:hypothetical protein